MKIAIIDCIGLHYDGTTLQKRGIGGSESAIISIAKELVKLGLEVTIFNDCNTEETNPGIYDGVTYQPIGSSVKDKFDIVISQRTVIPFTPIDQYDIVRQPPPRDYDPRWFTQFQSKDILKILWMQDTFIWGDLILEDLVVNGHIDEVFNLSDWHISYTINCDHGKKRIFEVLKDKIFHTRNGINRWIEEVDISAKDPHHFVYNASITKGMIPLVKHIWPKVKQRVPQARLTIIGGYYDFKDNDKSPYKDQWLDLYQSAKNDTSITFTGIIPQPKIAEIVANASYMIYPGAYPETSGIATIESVNYNTPILGTRFGAMNESGTEAAGYYIDYAIEPNSLFPGIPLEEQVNKFVEMTVNAVNTPYLHQQKMYACNNIKDISTWDTIALQWKQHFYHKFNQRLSDDEQKRVDWINYRVHKVFERRYSNPEEVQNYTSPELVQSLDQKRVRVAIIDIIGTCYDGDTLHRRGLGGSEAAVVQVANELSHIGFDVTVFNACDEDDCFPGVYGNVMYLPLNEIENAKDFDVVISSRVGTPFVPEYWNIEQASVRKVPYEYFRNIQNAKIKVLWMHDTFSSNDIIIEKLLVEQHINELWTLSDFHYNYLTNNTHGSTYSQMRNYEVLRNHTWITRNGMKLSKQIRNLSNKEPHHFVFNSNRLKGLHPLLHDVWPQVKKRIPNAKLTVVGGYYKLSKAVAYDNEYEDFMKMVGDAKDDASITFTGILSLESIYDIYAKASYLLYPTEYPETFGISTLEAQYHDMQVLTCKFGALEELAQPSDSMIDYSCTPNALKHDINRFEQAERLADLALKTVNQKNKSNQLKKFEQIREIAGWDTVALEWKQHIYSKLDLYLSASESEQSLYTRSQWQKIFGRRVTAPEQWVAPFSNDQRKIVVISPFYNADQFIERCIHSVAAQIYDNYEHILIDDCSTETSNAALNTIANLPENIRHKFKLIKNSTNQGAVYNHINTIRDLNDDDIVILLDGDDWLTNSPDIFQYYNRIHENNDFTYGSCWSVVDNIPLVSQPYPSQVKANKSYREHMFNWYAPYTHLRTLKAKLIKYEDDSVFMDKEKNWFKAGGDLATFYQAIENCDSDRIYCSADVVYQYNDAHPHNDYKINGEEQTKTARSIARIPAPPKEMFTVTIPTMWRCLDIFQRALIEYCNCDYINEVIIVNNDVKITPDWEILNHEKMIILNQEKNIKVNPAWNLGVKLAKNDRVAIINDDVVFDIKIFEKLQSKINNKSGVHGFITGEAHFNHPISTDYSISFMNMQHGISLFGFGMAMFLHKSNWIPIPEQFEIYYGDDFIIKTHMDKNLTPVMIYNHKFESPMASTSSDSLIVSDSYERESLLWQNMINQNNAPKKILIAIPCKNDIEADTFKSIYDLEVPEGYVTEFQYFYGYAVDQVRNLIAHWVVNTYDYLLAIDHDVVFPADTLKKMLVHDKPIVSGVYRQRLEPQMIELYDLNMHRLDVSQLTGTLQEIGGCGFGCVLVKKEVFSAIQYPWFFYHQALNHNHTFSEDLDFCKKVLEKGFKIYADSSILCKHIGQKVFEIELPKLQEDSITARLRELSNMDLLPSTHISYLKKIGHEGVQPKVIYDIGACVLHWTNSAKRIWPNSQFVAFEAMNSTEFLYQESKMPYVAGALLYKEDDVDIKFYQNLEHPGGNSMYRENPELSPAAKFLFDDHHMVMKKGMRLDTLVKMFNFDQPDLIKMDVQGAELDVLLGATETLKNCKDLILELQSEEYNIGSPKFDEVKSYLKSIGFQLVHGPFSSTTKFDGDYHFSRSHSLQ